MAWYGTPLLRNSSRSQAAMQERCFLCNVTSGVSYYHQANAADRVSLNTPLKAHTCTENFCHLQCSLSSERTVSYFESKSNLMHTPPLAPYLECNHEEKGSCKAEARCPQFLPPHPNHAALPGLPEQLELSVRKASLSEVFSLCCRAFPLHPYSSW